MMKILTSHWFSCLWTFLIMVLSIILSIYSGDVTYVARAGALVTLAGIFMTTRRLLVKSSENQSFNLLDNGLIDVVHKDAELAKEEEIEHLKAEKCGFWFLIMGTIIWAYGDLALRAFIS